MTRKSSTKPSGARGKSGPKPSITLRMLDCSLTLVLESERKYYLTFSISPSGNSSQLMLERLLVTQTDSSGKKRTRSRVLMGSSNRNSGLLKACVERLQNEIHGELGRLLSSSVDKVISSTRSPRPRRRTTTLRRTREHLSYD